MINIVAKIITGRTVAGWNGHTGLAFAGRKILD
jgi:hypothetical protein